MQNIKKYFMTLALLLTAVTGAWAQDTYTITFAANGNTKTVENVTLPKTYQCSYHNADGELDLILKELYSWMGNENQTFCDANTTPKSSDENKLVAGNDNGDHYITINNVFEGTVTITGNFVVNNIEKSYSLEISIAPTFPFPITWDATNKTTGFNLPAGNVFMNVEYYPEAALATAPAAKSDIKATTADAIVTAGTVAKIGETENAQGTLMYYAVQSETAPDAPDYDNKNWSDKIPTAADFNEGNVYVWYYVKGADGDAESTFNDGAITKLGESGYVTLAAPTYAITLKEGTEDADKWTIPAEAEEGATVTATYSGTKKVKSVKAVKKNTAYAANEYNEADWDNGKVVFTKQTAASVTAVANSDADVTWDKGWYTVSGNVTITGKVTLTNDVHLILQDGATLTINGQLDCWTNHKNLNIYGQDKGDGKLNVSYSDNMNGTAIYGNWETILEIHGGEITAAAIGDTGMGLEIDHFKMYGGKLTSTSKNNPGIQFTRDFEVYGGEVVGTTNSTSYPSNGIYGINGSLIVYGGKVKATGNGINDTEYGDYGSGFGCKVQSGTTGIKFYFSDDGTTWDSGTYYEAATTAPTNRYAKAE